ncbi:MAG: amino acid permease [Pirellulales bacterium]|nr:amino acid permease [Pirellulales bacterium]
MQPENPTDDPVIAPPLDGRTLAPVLGLFTAVTIVVGGVIGSGIFIVPNQVAKATEGYVGLILGLWVFCGIVNLCGALTLAELSAMFPHAGGTYVFLCEAYGRLWGYLWAWAEFWVIRSGSTAALAVAMSISMVGVCEAAGFTFTDASRGLFQKVTAAWAIGFLGVINIIGTRWGGVVQNLTTIVKAGCVAVLALLPFIAAGHERVALTGLWPETWTFGLISGIGLALSGIMWAYDGWGMVTVVAEEIKNPKRNIPLALGGGVILLTVLYAGANLGYHLTLPSSAIAAAPVPAVTVVETLIGPWGRNAVLALMMISIFGALNANILVGPRVLFAVARDHAPLKPLRHIDPRTGTPTVAIAGLSIWSCVLVLAGDLSPDPDHTLFELLTSYTVFGGSLFYFAAVASVFLFRIRDPERVRPYRTWGYPLVPLVFIAFYVFLLVSMVWATPLVCVIGLGLIATGFVPYAWTNRRGRR